ncbi:sigma factor-like helix-turn-helix DNA-binding protein [Fibrella forsythiae]|uniref:sigma factor-like helix-turn-helix DNA-binding protein n=1 Tax=Fibrella forsythiae TaxID=2817061 RepID=UPI001E4EF0A7|nr:sigma factor-like helix-turn-helix DNA-binding protein [Fibrella forsythiae]
MEERWEQLECALEQLLTADRDLLREKYLAQKDLATLAREAHLTLSAVKMRLKRARDKVKASLPADQRPGQSQSG